MTSVSPPGSPSESLDGTVSAHPVSAHATAARSLAHWSEAGRAEMDAFYVLATEDYRQLALAADWPEVLAGRQSILDVACGSGKFPTALRTYADLPATPGIGYDLLDPSAFSIAEAKACLSAPFEAGRELQVTLQDLPVGLTYDVVWATHALYAVPQAELPLAAERFVAAIAPGGLGFVAQASAASHYLQFYDAYRDAIPAARDVDPFTSAEQVRDALRATGVQVREQRVQYTSGTDDDAVAQGFLQRCAFDDSVTLDEMLAAPALGDYLAGCRSEDADGVRRWTFQHEAVLLWL